MDILTLHKLYSKKGIRLLLHILFWIAYFYLIGAKHFLKGEAREGLMDSLPVWVPYIFTFYLLVYVVFPATIYKQKYTAFVLFCLLVFMLYLIIDFYSCWMRVHTFMGARQTIYAARYYGNKIAGGLWNRFVNAGMFLTLFFELLYVIAFPLVIKISRDMRQLQHKTLSLQKANLQMELKFLKSQLNPHFLFNTLNNLDSLITLGRNKEASQTTIRLSQFMRYTLYECNDEFIALYKEAELIKNYIELERIRHKDLHIVMDFRIATADRFIPPLILLPFIENAFKHGVDLGIPEPKISILLQEDAQGVIYIVENTTCVQGRAKSEGTGIGLNNVKGRLKHYYPESHELSITEEHNVHRIQLKIRA